MDIRQRQAGESCDNCAFDPEHTGFCTLVTQGGMRYCHHYQAEATPFGNKETVGVASPLPRPPLFVKTGGWKEIMKKGYDGRNKRT